MAEAHREKTPQQVDPASFVHGGTPVEAIGVKISYGIIDRFSEGLYSSPNKAFEELVSNSYDAGAKRVWVTMPHSLTKDSKIAVIDDGESMDLQGLHELWEIGVSPKREHEDPASERLEIGKFGIGKLATYVLANELTYVCKRGETYLAVTMDYRAARGEGKQLTDVSPISLQVVSLSESEATDSLREVLNERDPAFRTLFGGGTVPECWTAAVLSSLRPRGRQIKQGTLIWILRTALPIHPNFRLWFNHEELVPAKASGEVDWEWQVGPSDTAEENWSYDVGGDARGRSGVVLPHAGHIRGSAHLYRDTLKKGKSEKWERSHGFFVKVRDRLINVSDETFGIDVELRHGTFTRFRMEVNADGLDPYISSPRESLQESDALEEVREYLLRVFNRARVKLAKIEESRAPAFLAAAERIAAAPAALSSRPLRRCLRRAISDPDPALTIALGLESERGREAAVKLLDSHDELLVDVTLQSLGDEHRLSSYDPQTRAVILNADHPFAMNYVDHPVALETLKMFAVTELLTEVFMFDEDLSPLLVDRISSRRDQFLKALVKIYPRSAAVIARALRDSKRLEKELEDAVADGLHVLGFEVRRIGGTGNPDGVARAGLGSRARGGISTSYSVTYDSKAIVRAQVERIAADKTRTGILRIHRGYVDPPARYSLIVAPGYQGEDLDEALYEQLCTNDEVAPIKVDDLARLVEVAPFKGINPNVVEPMFRLRSVRATAEFVDAMETRDATDPSLVVRVLHEIRREADRSDATSIDGIALLIGRDLGRDVTGDEIRTVIRALHFIAPTAIWVEGGHVALNGSIGHVLNELRRAVDALPVELTQELRGALATASEDVAG